MVNFLILLILHFIGDFYFQTSRIARCKNANIGENCNGCKSCKTKALFNNKFLFIHTLLYTVPFLFLFLMTKWTNALVIIATVLLSHYIIDVIACCLNKKTKQTLVFIVDQLLHTLVLFVAYKLFDMNSCFIEYELFVKIVFAILFLLVPSSVFVNKLFQDLFTHSEQDKTSPNTPQEDEQDKTSQDLSTKNKQDKIFDVGSIIGMLERALVLVFAYFSDFAAIAIIITVKTWARSGDLRKNKEDFRDKYLLGTLASLVLALIAFLIFKL